MNDTTLYVGALWFSGFLAGLSAFAGLLLVALRCGWIRITE